MRLPAIAPGITGAAVTFAGIGLARFAYTPLIPAMVDAAWFSGSQAAYLGAANLLGYLVGAVSAHRLAERLGAEHCLRASFVAVVLSFLLCAADAPFAWFFLWRFAAGLGGAVLMVVGVSMVIAAVPPARRAATAAQSFTGIGIGVLLSAILVPVLLRTGLTAAWVALGACALAATILGWRCRQPGEKPATEASAQAPPARALLALSATVIVAYTLDAVGFVPHTVFWVDYLARGLGLGMAAASLQWALFGVGAVFGPLVVGRVAGRLGWRSALTGALAAKAVIVGLPLITSTPVALAVSSLAMGALVPGVVTLTSGRLAEIVGIAAHRRVWGWATAAFALAQAAAGYGFAALFAASGYAPLFAGAAAALALAAVASHAGPHHTSATTAREGACRS